MRTSGLSPRAGRAGHAVLAFATWLVAAPVGADATLDRELRRAAMVGDTPAIAELLERGASVNAANEFGKSALMIAVESDSMDAVALLLARGADVNARTVAGCTSSGR